MTILIGIKRLKALRLKPDISKCRNCKYSELICIKGVEYACMKYANTYEHREFDEKGHCLSYARREKARSKTGMRLHNDHKDTTLCEYLADKIKVMR